MNKKKLIIYSVSFSVGLFIAWLVLAYYKTQYCFSFGMEKDSLYSSLSDIFLVPAAVLMSVGLIIAVSDEGFFDFFSYCMKCFTYMFNPKNPNKEKFFEYRERKREHRKEHAPWPVFLTGLFYLAVCLLFTILWYTVR